MESINKKTSQPLKWDIMLRLVADLIKDKRYKETMIISLGAYLGLRHSDIVRLSWNDILTSDKLQLIETKTAKLKRVREIQINPELKRIAEICRNGKDGDRLIFGNKFNSPESIQNHNKLLSNIKTKYPYIDIESFSTHSNRKCFALRVYEQLGSSEHALIALMRLLHHTSILTTTAYIGLQATIEEQVYLNL
jgi:integrase